MDDIAMRPAHKLVGLIAAGQVSSREVLETFLDRIERLDGPVNAVVTRMSSAPAPRPPTRTRAWPTVSCSARCTADP